MRGDPAQLDRTLVSGFVQDELSLTKTLALIAGSIEAGAVLATDDDAVIARYRAFGWALGLAFQVNDDLLGIWGEEERTGKVPTDLLNRKKTLPVIYAFEHGLTGEIGVANAPFEHVE